MGGLGADAMIVGGGEGGGGGDGLSVSATVCAGVGAGAGAGKTIRLVGRWNTARKRNGAGPTRRKYPGPVDAATALTIAMNTMNTARQLRNSFCLMRLCSLFLNTIIQKGIGVFGAKL